MESVIYLITYVASLILLHKLGLGAFAWLLLLTPIILLLVFFLIFGGTIYGLKKMASKGNLEKLLQAKKDSILATADAEAAQVDVDAAIEDDNGDNTVPDSLDVSVDKTGGSNSTEGTCYAVGGLNAGNDHPSNKACKGLSGQDVFRNDKCTDTKCGVNMNDSLGNICCQPDCCSSLPPVVPASSIPEDATTDTITDTITDTTTDTTTEEFTTLLNKSHPQYSNYDPSAQLELNYRDFL